MNTHAFAGTAEDYLRYRPAYPDTFLALLRVRARTTGGGTLLDLACGPGRVALPMAAHFERVLAVDVEPQMTSVGEREARRRGLTNIEWRTSRAEALLLPASSLELVAIGDAFHRLDQPHVLREALRWLVPGGSIATLGSEPVWRGPEKWKRVLVDVVNGWTSGVLGDPNERAWGGPVAELGAAGFRVEEHDVFVDAEWTIDSIVGYMRSTSIASRRALGERATAFEADLRRALLAGEPSARFTCRQLFGFTLGVVDGR